MNKDLYKALMVPVLFGSAMNSLDRGPDGDASTRYKKYECKAEGCTNTAEKNHLYCSKECYLNNN